MCVTMSVCIRKQLTLYIIVVVILSWIPYYCAKKNVPKSAVEELTDIKEFKKILRTKNNVLVCFTRSSKDVSHLMKSFRESAEIVRGIGTLVYVDCSGEGKKLCKKLKVVPEPYTIKHYKDGNFHKDYDRKESVQSVVNFMKDPTGDLPWEEDNTLVDVVHIPDPPGLMKFLKKESKGILIMFYAPWCGFCKRLKPEFSAAATELKGQSVLAALDINRPENTIIRQHYNISGFPTLLYFQGGNLRYKYEGENTKDGIINFMKNPGKPVEKSKEEEWSEVESDVVHLDTDTFDDFIKDEPSVMVMFYAPWCGHCKRMKPEYMTAATQLKDKDIEGRLAAVDAQKEVALGTKYGIKGYPTVKYFKDGEFAYDVNVRDADAIVEFMQDPKEPPPPPPPEKPWSEEESDVVHLTDDSFKIFLRKKKHVLVMFYAPWCGHCKQAKPEFTSAALRFSDDSKVEFAAVDCTTHKTVCDQNGVKGYPTIKYFNYFNRDVRDYQGSRTESGFVSFMEDPQNPLSTTTPSTPSPEEEWAPLKGAQFLHHLGDRNFDSFMEEQESVLVMFYAPWCGHCKAMKGDYALAAQKMQEENIPGVLATVDATTETMLQERYSIKGFPTLKYFRNGKPVGEYDKKRTAVDIIAYMSSPPTSKDEL